MRRTDKSSVLIVDNTISVDVIVNKTTFVAQSDYSSTVERRNRLTNRCSGDGTTSKSAITWLEVRDQVGHFVLIVRDVRVDGLFESSFSRITPAQSKIETSILHVSKVYKWRLRVEAGGWKSHVKIIKVAKARESIRVELKR